MVTKGSLINRVVYYFTTTLGAGSLSFHNPEPQNMVEYNKRLTDVILLQLDNHATVEEFKDVLLTCKPDFLDPYLKRLKLIATFNCSQVYDHNLFLLLCPN